MHETLRIVIPGGSGFAGRILARYFHERGHSVAVLARGEAAFPWRTVHWNGVDAGGWEREIDGADAVINLAGCSVNCRYNQANRREILNSRIDSTRAIGEAIRRAARPPALWMNAATATIYRHSLDRDMDEETGETGGHEPGAPSSWRFSIDVATRWEQAFFGVATPGTRKIALRMAMIMAPQEGGAWATLRKLARAGLGGKAASGKQYISWIHDRDFARAVDFLIRRNDLEGCVNVCAPAPVTNREFMKALRDACGARIGLPAPRWLLEFGAIFLRTETELILKSRRVVPRRLLEAGFDFEFPYWPEAAVELERRQNGG